MGVCRVDSGCVLVSRSGGEGRVKVRCKRSFLHLHLTHFTTPLFREYNHFNNCLPSSAPPPPPPPPTSLSTDKNDDVYREICCTLSTSLFKPNHEKVQCVQVEGFRSRFKLFESNSFCFFKLCWIEFS